MTRAVPEAPATHFRLSQDSWAQIAQAYRNGATARELAVKWKVSPTTIYRYACRDGFTKKRDSDAIARAHAQMITDEETADLGGGYLAPASLPDATPGALKRRALEDMARALAAGRVTEADRLGRLLLTLGKVSGFRDDDDDDMDDDDVPRKRGPITTTPQAFAEAIFPIVERVALQMLGDTYHGPSIFSRAAMRWRAATFGPECAANDYRQMCARGWTKGVYDEDANILPGWDSPNVRHPQVEAPPGYKGFDKDRITPQTPTAGATPNTPPASP
ncbi:MAG: hypothetical protein Q7U20_05995 [Caulobacter sp.]|nr:hypothetical protein [Caulobacter sp.]